MFEFDFEVQGDNIEFNFIFMSEEYNEYVNTGFNDVFAFYISGPGIVGQQNLAVVPGTTTPVSINTINNGYDLISAAVLRSRAAISTLRWR